MVRLLNATSINKTKRGRRYDIQLNHGFRKRFNTILKLNSDINSNIAEKIMAHKRGLDGTYLKPTMMECFNEFKKAILELTVDDTERLKIKNKEQAQEISEIKKLTKSVEDLKKENIVEVQTISFVNKILAHIAESGKLPTKEKRIEWTDDSLKQIGMTEKELSEFVSSRLKAIKK